MIINNDLILYVLYILIISQKDIKEFQDQVRNHLTAIENKGSVSRIEVLYKFDIDKDLYKQIEHGILNTVTIVQSDTKSYTFKIWARWINLYVSALKFRIKLITQLVSDTMLTNNVDLIQQVSNEVMGPIVEICHIIGLFFTGRQFLKSTTLPCLSFVANRPTLTKLRKHTFNALLNKLNFCGINLMNKFYEKLNPSNIPVRVEIPDYVPFKAQYNASNRKGYACRKCFRVFTSLTDDDPLPDHICKINNIKANKININVKQYKNTCDNSSSQLGKDQIQVFDFIISSTKNMFVTGPAGTGKSYLMMLVARYLYIKYGVDSLEIIAYTNQAAQNVNGKTLHSFLGANHTTKFYKLDRDGNTQNDPSNNLNLNSIQNNVLQYKNQKDNLQFIILDEVSMVTGSMLYTLDKYLRLIKCIDQPFGGVRMILVGDVLQIPPVEENKNIFHSDLFYYHPIFYEDSNNFFVAYLKEVFRQDDAFYTKMNIAMRYGQVSKYYLDKFQECGKYVPRKDFEFTYNILHTSKTLTNMTEHKNSWYVDQDRIINYESNFVLNKHGKQSDSDIEQHPTFIACVETKEVTELNQEYINRFQDSIKTYKITKYDLKKKKK